MARSIIIDSKPQYLTNIELGLLMGVILTVYTILGIMFSISAPSATIIVAIIGIISAIITAFLGYYYKEQSTLTWSRNDEIWKGLFEPTTKIVGDFKQMHMIARAYSALDPRKPLTNIEMRRRVVEYGEWMVVTYPDIFKDNTDLIKGIRGILTTQELKIDVEKVKKIIDDSQKMSGSWNDASLIKQLFNELSIVVLAHPDPKVFERIRTDLLDLLDLNQEFDIKKIRQLMCDLQAAIPEGNSTPLFKELCNDLLRASFDENKKENIEGLFEDVRNLLANKKMPGIRGIKEILRLLDEIGAIRELVNELIQLVSGDQPIMKNLEELIRECRDLLFGNQTAEAKKLEEIRQYLLATLHSEFLRLTSEINATKTTLAVIAASGKKMIEVIDDLSNLLQTAFDDKSYSRYMSPENLEKLLSRYKVSDYEPIDAKDRQETKIRVSKDKKIPMGNLIRAEISRLQDICSQELEITRMGKHGELYKEVLNEP